MDAAEDAASKLPSLYAQLAVKSSRVAELEARVSALETENAGLREALAVGRREATGSTGGEEDPVLRGINHEAVDKRGGAVARDAIEVSDDEEGAAAVGANKGGSPEEGVGAVPAPRKRVVVGETEGEADAEDADGGGGSNGESSAGLEDDDVSVTPRGKKRGRGAAAARVVTSDSEDDDGDDEDGLGSGKDDGDGQEGLMSSRKRAFRRVSDSEDENGDEDEAPHQTGSGEAGVDDMVPIYELLKRVPSEDGDESDETKVHFAPVTRRSARLVKRVPGEDDDESDDAKGHSAPTRRRSARLVKNQSKYNHIFCGVSDSEDEDDNEEIATPQAESGHEETVDDMVPICELLKRVPKERVGEDDDESDDAKRHSAPVTRRSARLAKNQSKSNRVFHGVSDSEDDDGSDSEDDDGNEGIAAPQTESGDEGEDTVLIYKSLKRTPKERASGNDDESHVAKGHSTPATRRSARLVKNQSKSDRVFHEVSDSKDEDGDEGIAAPQTESGDKEDDMVLINKSLKRMPKEKVSEDSDESNVAKGHSTPASRRSARLVKNQSKGRRAACLGLHFVEPPKDVEGSEDDMEEDDDMNEFINDGSSDNASDSAEESCDESDAPSVLNEKSSPGLEVSDGEVDYKDVMACIGRQKKAKEWDYEADMLAAFGEHPELCLRAVCAIYRKQTEDEQVEKASLFHNKQGFSNRDAQRGSEIAEFLLDGDRDGPVKKTVSDLDEYDRYAFEFCRKAASHYSKQLFAIYQNKEDPYFHP